MNKYLLLRDNKQSGPYTVPELAELGIKAYDLVWLDGKSAAWRYPSEIEELKAYAPAIEEQPFDRFYKRPEPIQQQKPEHVAYAPKLDDQPVPAQPPKADKKVYINFPVTNPAPKKVQAPQPTHHTPSPTYSEPVTPGFAEQTFYKQAAEVIASRHTPSTTTTTDKRVVYGAIAACVVLVGFIAVLLVNNSTQQNKLNELNTIVRQIEQKNAAAVAPVTQVKTEQAAPAPETSETIINPELLNLAHDESSSPVQNQTEKNQAASLATIPPAETAKKAEQKLINADGVSFTERPVLRRTDAEAASEEIKEAKTDTKESSENLFKQVAITQNKYKTGVLGGISNLQLQLTNNSNRELQKVAVEIKYLGPEKKVVNTQTVYFENISANGQATIDVPKSKRGVTINYTITDIKS